MSGTKRKKGQGKRLTDAQRLEIIHIIEGENCPTLRSIARQFGVGEKTIRNVKTKREEIKERVSMMSESCRQNSKRVSVALIPSLEKRIFDWIYATRQAGLILPPCIIQHKARAIAAKMGISTKQFKASYCWLDNFLKRWDIDIQKFEGGRDQVDEVEQNELEEQENFPSFDETPEESSDDEEERETGTDLDELLMQLRSMHESLPLLKLESAESKENMIKCLHTCAKLQLQLLQLKSSILAEEQSTSIMNIPSYE